MAMIMGVLLGACSAVRPTSTEAPETETPAAPAVSAGTHGQASVTVMWTAPAAELTVTGYELQWRTDSNMAWTAVTGLASTATSYTITGLQPQTTYKVRVRALFATTAGAWSEPITVSTTAPPERPPASDGPRISEPTAGSNSITVTWTAPATDETITGYELNWRRSTDVDWTVETGISSAETSYAITGLQPQTSYRVRVRALFATTAGAWSESISVRTTAPGARPPPSDRPRLSLAAARTDSITVEWVAPATAKSITSYEVQVSGGSLEVETFTGIPGTDTRVTIEGLQPQTTYRVQVRAMFDDVAGPWFASLTVTTPELPVVRFECKSCQQECKSCQQGKLEGVAAADKGFSAHLALARRFTPETFPMTIRYEVSETGDMLKSTAKGEFETPSVGETAHGRFYAYPRIRLPIIDDGVDEPLSTITVRILPDPRYRVGHPSTSTTYIVDDDDPPSVEVDDVAVTEGDSGTVNATFTGSLSTASGRTVTVDWATSDGTATAGTDYTAGSGTLTFAAGDTSKTFDVAVTGDTADEDNETFTVTLSNASNASVPDATATGTITDDD
ncbi:MAG: fibronectin type III domain-containing protein [Spirochaetaceae bacterium]|nr:fibronectin type III domain-containing protein [Spirochaetaceae bacterium]